MLFSRGTIGINSPFNRTEITDMVLASMTAITQSSNDILYERIREIVLSGSETSTHTTLTQVDERSDYGVIPDIEKLLVAAGLGVVGIDLFGGFQPANPTDCITIMEYAGMPPERNHSSNNLKRPGINIRVRNASYPLGRVAIQKIVDELEGTTEYQGNYGRYLSIFAQQEPYPLGQDKNGNVQFVVNFICTIAR